MCAGPGRCHPRLEVESMPILSGTWAPVAGFCREMSGRPLGSGSARDFCATTAWKRARLRPIILRSASFYGSTRARRRPRVHQAAYMPNIALYRPPCCLATRSSFFSDSSGSLRPSSAEIRGASQCRFRLIAHGKTRAPESRSSPGTSRRTRLDGSAAARTVTRPADEESAIPQIHPHCLWRISGRLAAHRFR